MDYKRLENLAMNDNGFIFDPNTGYSYTSNATGIYILKLLAAGLEKESIRAQLIAEYEVNEDNFNSDFEHFTLMLEALDLVSF
ncbi:MAG: PqqD family protein [Candidatus Cloacimonadales bacterium]|jgi:hypothetical protein|nr:PqqD family protein [Candidatus Cloacimonadota bacterium]MDY0381010.1 PqqD family protein [Candidatus Cloacimonadaceae bacterium]HCM15244.1 HPr-rel-A system PqqD family protein [Candidatus Cloacimonas sp.]MCB5263339.1 PqqD family protein [Candidatus Cloacimonadota bacterium]MCB5276655.1 PqqD family protein [Candidatus Cloacimonadota bacterium]